MEKIRFQFVFLFYYRHENSLDIEGFIVRSMRMYYNIIVNRAIYVCIQSCNYAVAIVNTHLSACIQCILTIGISTIE